MPPEPIITETTPRLDVKRHFKVRSPLLYGLVFALLCVVAVPFLVTEWGKGTAPAVETLIVSDAPVIDEPEVLRGKIYMSLAPRDADTHYALDIYSYDVESGLITQETDEDNREYLTSKISPDGTAMAVASLSNDGEEVTSDTGLFIVDRKTGETVEVETREDTISKRSPTWSHDSKYVAFVALTDDGADRLVPENWSLYVYGVGNSGTARFLTKGVNPVFLPDGNLVVLKNDGIYYVKTQGNAETNIFPFSAPVGTNVKFDVSRDGKNIALSLADHNELVLIPVTSWAPFERGEMTSIPTSSFWPVFSPGGDFLAMQVFDWSDETPERIPMNQRLMIFSLRDREWLNSVDLTPYDQNMLFITDWH